MSFRRRLALFFALIVVVPMAGLALLLVVVTREANVGKTDAQLGQALETAEAVFATERKRSRAALDRIAEDAGLSAAIRAGDPAAARSRAAALAATGEAASVRAYDRGGNELAHVGAPLAIAGVRAELQQADANIGAVEVAARSARGYLREVEELTGVRGALVRGQRAITENDAIDPGALPQSGDVEIRGEEARAGSIVLDEPAGDSTRLTLLARPEADGVLDSEPIIAAGLVLFFGLALIFTLTLMRTLQAQVQAMLDAAVRIGRGDFSERLPEEGGDELAALARQFNLMSGQLAEKIGQLELERERLQASFHRLGEAFASGLDRRALLEIVVESAVDACHADAGRIRQEGDAGPVVGAELDEEALSVLAETEALAAERQGIQSASRDRHHALAHALEPVAGRGGSMAIVREDGPFGASERTTFTYLARQARISIENASLHELVARQALTDALTGLANPRRLHETLESEIGRARRFEHPLSLVMLDIDDFKEMNDTYGHLQGDEVLRQIAAVLQSLSREVDEPARYGGEELCVVLPETDLQGAYEVAERMRKQIAATEIPRLDDGETLRVTASFGVAILREGVDEASKLIADADDALYRAKRAGKNRTERAPARSAGAAEPR